MNVQLEVCVLQGKNIPTCHEDIIFILIILHIGNLYHFSLFDTDILG